jgi:hypothetical protein
MDHTQPLALSRARRLAKMGLAEIGYRTRQQSAKWLDRLTLDGAQADAAEVLRRHAPSFGDSLVHELGATIDARFFTGVSATSIDHIRRRFHHQALIAEADDRLSLRFDLLGYKGLSFGYPIDWHVDPVHQRRAPLVHWSRINPLDAGAVGDSKIVWELSRQQWVVRLSQAYAITGDERYADAAIDAIEQWLYANPEGFGINWASSLEVAFRIIAWTWTIALLRTSDALSNAAAAPIVASIHTHATHVEKYLSQYYSPNTHLTGEALGLVYAGTIFPQFRESSRWQAVGAGTLSEEALRQISADGMYFEQSTCYQRYSCEIFLHFLLLASRADLAVSEDVTERLRRMVDALAALQRPGGSMPSIGDADGGQLLSLVPREPADYSGMFAVAAAYFERPEFARAAGSIAPEVMWLMGEEGGAAFERAYHTRPRPARSCIFVEGGYAVMRDDRVDHQMIVDVGPLGAYAHGHADLLSIQCDIFGEPCLVDPGTGGYTPEPEWRNYFRGTAAHSTICVNELGQADPDGPFGWHTRPTTRVRAWQSTSELDFVDADHDAWRDAGIRHRRRVVYVKPAFWVVIDDLEGSGTATAELSWQFAPALVSLEPDGRADAVLASGARLWVLPLSTCELQAFVKMGDTQPIRGWISPDYGVRQAAPMLVHAGLAALPMRVITVLYPDHASDERAPSVRAIGHDGIPTAVHVQPTNVTVHFDTTPVVIERG